MVIKIPETRFTRSVLIAISHLDRWDRINPMVAIIITQGRAVTVAFSASTRRPPDGKVRVFGFFSEAH